MENWHMTIGCTRKKDYPVVITVVSVKGRCTLGIKEGDSWTIERNVTPSNFCMNAFTNIYPTLRTFMYGGEQRWDSKDRARTLLMCPDFVNQVMYEIKRIRPDEPVE
jgi:uncharacterized repeat protein (TIGR04076 family)